MKIIVLGLDGAKANFGMARMAYDAETGKLELIRLDLVKTQKSTSKQVRQSSDTLRRAREIACALRAATQDVSVVFGEVPSGGQSAAAVHSFGVVIGLYASIEAPFVEVAPHETKMAAVGTRTASKQEMIEWATGLYPDANWRYTTRGGAKVPTLDNEHLADAVAVVHAGIRTPAFQQAVAMSRVHHAAVESK